LEFGTGMSLALTWATTNGSIFCSVPDVTPVTTTWLSLLMSGASEKFCVDAPAEIVMVRVCGV